MTERTHLTVRLDDETRHALEKLLGEEPERGRLAVIARDAIHRYAQQQGGVLWVGQGIWEGWTITTNHTDSSHGQPVLVDPEGGAYAPGDLLPGFGQVR